MHTIKFRNRVGLGLLLAIGLVSLASFEASDTEPHFSHPFKVENSVEHDAGIYSAYQSKLLRVANEANKTLFYYSDIFTPVCDDHTCKPVNIRLYWDACGTFLAFDVPDEEPLTKKGHQHFGLDDYRTLYYILNNPEAAVSKLTKRNLVRHEGYQPIDGFSGATANFAQEVVVQGAAFTTYTLWHAVYGLSDSLPKTLVTPIEDADYWAQSCSTLKNMTTYELTQWLYHANLSGMLGKRAVWQVVIGQLNSLSDFNALLVANYLNRRIPVKEPIQNAIRDQKELKVVYMAMMPSEKK